MRYHWIDGQTVEYRVLHCMELGCFQGWQVVLKLMSKPNEALRTDQIAGALQRLKRQGLIEHKQGQWRFVEPEMYKAQQDAAIKRATQAKQGEQANG